MGNLDLLIQIERFVHLSEELTNSSTIDELLEALANASEGEEDEEWT